ARMANMVKTVRTVDALCSELGTLTLVKKGEMDGPNSIEARLKEIEAELLRQLEFYRWGTLPRVHWFVTRETLDALLAIRNRGQENFVELFTREVVSDLFKQRFGNPYGALAHDVSQVIGGIADSVLTREQKRN